MIMMMKVWATISLMFLLTFEQNVVFITSLKNIDKKAEESDWF